MQSIHTQNGNHYLPAVFDLLQSIKNILQRASCIVGEWWTNFDVVEWNQKQTKCTKAK